MKRTLFLSAFVFIAAIVFAPKAHALLYGYPMNNSVCPADESYSQCIADGYTSAGGTAGSGSPNCGSHPKDGFECVRNCKCQYDNYVKKCRGRRACMETQRSDYQACLTQCEIDFT
jgi:hypothetical protein